MLDKLSNLNPLSRLSNSNNINGVKKSSGKDSISISSDAAKLSQMHALQAKVKMTPDVRMDRIQEVQAKMEDPNYILNSLEGTADKILEDWGL